MKPRYSRWIAVFISVSQVYQSPVVFPEVVTDANENAVNISQPFHSGLMRHATIKFYKTFRFQQFKHLFRAVIFCNHSPFNFKIY